MARPTKRGLTSEGGSMSKRERESVGVGVGRACWPEHIMTKLNSK